MYSIIAENAVLPQAVPQSAESTLPLPSVPLSPGRRAGWEGGRAVCEGVCVTVRQHPLMQRSSFLSF